MLSEEQKRRILELARNAVTAQVTGASVAIPQTDDLPRSSGAFVTLKRRGELRGCLGTLQCSRGLAEEVVRCAADAASHDPRFPPVGPNELPDISLEVSVLGPLEPIDPVDPNAVTVGTHGLVVEQGRRRGLLLPQVATEWGWTAEQFLAQTCVKAGLPPDAWRTARVSRFTAEVFAEPR